MKKLFSIFCCLLLSASMVTQAQLLDAVNDSPERGYVFDDNGQVSGRNNAPQANYTQHYSWTTDLAVNGIVMNSGSSLGNSNYIVWQCQLVPNYLKTNSITYPAVSFSFGINYYSSGYATYDSGQEGPLPGTYAYSNTTTWGQIPGKLVCNQSLNKSFFINSSGTKLYFTGGSVVVQQGRHGRPYMYTSSLRNSSNNFDITIGDPCSITTTYTSVTVAKADENNKVVLYANDGNGNNLNLIFNVGSIDTNIGVPAGTYTIGTNAWGSLHDDDGYTDWSLTSGSITISKNGSALSMSTSSLKGKVDDTNYNLNLTISNRTPTMKTITNIPVASASVNKYSGYFNVIGSSSPYDVRLESASVDYRTGYFAHNELEQTNEYTYLKQNNSNIALDYNKQQALITAVGSNIFTEAFVCSTSGTVYRIAAFNGAAYTITYKDQGDAAFTGTHSSGYPTTHLYGTNTPLGTATKSNHTFDGWFDNSSCTGTPLTSIEATAKTSNFTLYAKWTNNTPVGTTYTLTLNAGAHGTVTVYNNTKNYNVTFTNNEAQIAENDEIVITYTPAAGYHVDTHTDSEEGTFNSGDGIFMEGDHTITVTFEPDVYNITYKDKGNVAFTGTHGSGYPTTHAYGTATALVNPTKANATFGGWYENSSCTGSAVSSLGANAYTSNITLYAKWISNGTITGVADHGTISGTGNYVGGTAVQLGVTAADGYSFTQWSDGNTDNPRTVIVDGDATYTAQFVEVISIVTKAGVIHGNQGKSWIQIWGTASNGYSAKFSIYTSLTTDIDDRHITGASNFNTGIPYTYITTPSNNQYAINSYDVYLSYDANHRVMSITSDLTADDGNRYHVDITSNHIYNVYSGNYGIYVMDADESSNFGPYNFANVSWDGTFLSGGDNSYFIDLSVFPLTTGSGNVPSGTYSINGSGDAGTINVGAYPINGTSIYGSFVRRISDNAYWFLRYGDVDIINNDEQYYAVVSGYNSWDNTIDVTMGTAPVNVTVNAGPNGTVAMSQHFINWTKEDQSYTTGETHQFMVGNQLILTPTPSQGYLFDLWLGGSPIDNGDGTYTLNVSGATNLTAQWIPLTYNLTYEGLEGATNTNNPTSYNIETETITLADPGTRDGYIFAGWKDESNNTITQIAKGSTGNRTLTATWNVKSSNIELCEKCDNNHYNTFKTNYNGETVNVTYNRQFAEGRWSTMCLPFSLNLAKMTANNMYGCVYEFKYATGNANVGSGVNLYFSNAKSIEAGKCYIVNANSALAEKTSFVFSGVTIDLSKDNGADLSSPATPEASIAAYNALPGYKSEGTIELVGTLRNGILMGTATGNKYMGLKENKIYYPNISQGSTIWAYRGIFRSSEILDKESMQKMRIIVDGEDRGELIIDADGDILAPSDAQSRKFIENGVLYIEREGVIYDAQGKRIK